MSEWKKYKLRDLTIDGKGTYGIAAPAVARDCNKYTYLRITDINDDGTLNKADLKSVDDANANKYILQKHDIVFARTGASVGRSYYYEDTDGILVYAGFLIKFSLDPNKINTKILKYYTHSKSYYDWVLSVDNGATRGNINAPIYLDMPIELPSRVEQDRIVGILSALDDKIELNRRINANLELQAQTLFNHWFVENKSADWVQGVASDFYDITIGKTPPRKESQWFTNNNQDVVWVSISDMGSSGLYIEDSSEYLTKDAINQFNIVVVPDNTVILSFKLTIGRVAITNGKLTTNEAIAHFKTDKEYLTEYTYLTLKKYNYAGLGSTSSIATAINSKIIKSMPFFMPDEKTLTEFHNTVKPIFATIKNNIAVNNRLAQLRDALLPKLMNGEIK